MANLKSFEEFCATQEPSREEEIQQDTIELGTPDVKSTEETEEESEEVQAEESAVQESEEETEEESIEEETEEETEEVKKVSEMLKEVYEACKNEAKTWAEDAHDEHTVESYMKENAALVAGLAASSLKEMQGDLETEAYESALNQISEAFTKKINECKESESIPDAGAVE